MEEGANLRITLKRLMEENGYTLEEYGRRAEEAKNSGHAGAAECLKGATQSVTAAHKALKAALELIK